MNVYIIYTSVLVIFMVGFGFRFSRDQLSHEDILFSSVLSILWPLTLFLGIIALLLISLFYAGRFLGEWFDEWN